MVLLTYGHWLPWENLSGKAVTPMHPDRVSALGKNQPYILCVRLHPDELENM
jgi:hypothetical protein